MSSVAPTVTPAALPQVQAPPTATLNAPPPELANLNIGAKLDAIILSALSARGLVEIETSLGKLQLQTGFPLPKDGSLQLQLIGKGSQLQFLISAIGGKVPVLGPRPPGGANISAGASINPSANVKTPAAGSNSAMGDAAPVKLTLGSQTIATLLRASTLSTPGPAQPASGASASLPAAVTSSTTSTNPASGQSSRALSGHIVAQGTKGTINTGQPQIQNQGVTVPAGTRISVQITGIIPANRLASGGGLPNSGPSFLAPGQTITGVVVGQSSTHQPIVQTHAGPISISTSSPIPQGTTITFQLISLMADTKANNPHAITGRAGSIIMETREWQALDDALRTLGESNPAIAQQLVNATLPRLDSALSANILFFIVALRGVEIRNWFGDAPTRALERLKPELLSRLRDDFGQIAKLSDDNSGGDWRAIPVPLLNGSAIEQIHLFLRRKKSGAEDDEGAPETRFVIDVDLCHIGRLQLDGLIVQEKKKFDLIIRTNDRLTTTIQNNIREIFTNSAELTGMTGGLAFHAAPPDFIDIATDTTDDGGLGLVV